MLVHPASDWRLKGQIHTSLSPGSLPKPLSRCEAHLSAPPLPFPTPASCPLLQLLISLCSTASSPSHCTHSYLLPLPFRSPPIPLLCRPPQLFSGRAANGGRGLSPSPRRSLQRGRRSRSRGSPKTGEWHQSTAHWSPTASLCNSWHVAVPGCHAHSAWDGKVPEIQKYVQGWLSFS